jgi:MFS family permease
MYDRRAWGLLAAFGVFGVFWGGWAAVLPDIKNAVGGSDAAFGLALLGVGTGALSAMLAMGVVYDRYGERTVAPLLVLFALSTLLPGPTSSVAMLFVALFAMGALSGMLDVAINAATTAWEASTGRRLLNLAHATFSGFFRSRVSPWGSLAARAPAT